MGFFLVSLRLERFFFNRPFPWWGYIYCVSTHLLKPASLGILQKLLCLSPEGSVLLLLLLYHCHWRQSQQSSFPPLSLPGSFEQHHPNCSSLCLPSPRGIKGPSSRMASAPYFGGTSLSAWFLAHSCTVSCQGMNISWCCSFWLVILTAVNGISLSQTSLKVLHQGGWFLLWLNHTLCPPVNRASACQSWEFYAFRSCLRVGVFGTDEIQPEWINSHCF